MPDIEDVVKSQFSSMLCELERRATASRRSNSYYDGLAPVPKAVESAKITNAYRTLMGLAQAPWASVVVDSVQDRLEVAGIRTDDKDVKARLWRVWQENGMDAESKLAHNAALIDGRSFATVWPDPDDTDRPEITLDGAEQMIVMYREGSRRRRVAALRCWIEDDDLALATVYRPEALYKFREVTAEKRDATAFKAGERWWMPREVDDEPWPLPNPLKVVPVVELAVNRRLKPGAFPYARGEFAHCHGLLDRISLLTFLGLVVALWMGFPLRGVIGEKILKDDDGNDLAPFDSRPDSVVQFEDPQAKVFQLDAADRKNLSIFGELAQLAYVTKTPAHYFPLESGLSNISADAIRALEGGQHAKVSDHKATLGEGEEEILRLSGLILPGPVILPPGGELLWKDHESRSLAERADAATKLASIDGMPWQVVAELALNMTQDEIARAEAGGAGNALTSLLKGIGEADPTPTLDPEPALT